MIQRAGNLCNLVSLRPYGTRPRAICFNKVVLYNALCANGRKQLLFVTVFVILEVEACEIRLSGH